MAGLREFFSGFKAGMQLFGHGIATIVNVTLLSVVYWIGVGITSMIAKIMGKRFLDMELDKKAKTYWKDYNLTKRPIEEYYRQF